MSELKLEFVGKQVKDMYGTLMGNVVGVITDTDGSIESVSVDCGDSGLKQLSYEQLLVQGDYVIFIPKWRLDAQKLFRQKNLTLKRIKALQHLVEEDDTMKEDAEIVYVKYEKKLHELEEKEKSINEKLKERLDDLNGSTKNIKSILFDAKLQYKSHEISEETYLQVTRYTKELMDHINLEKKENSKTYTNTNSVNPTITNTPNTTTTTTTVTASNTNNSNSSTLPVSSTSDNTQTKHSYSAETDKYKQHVPSNNADTYSKPTKDKIEKSTTDNEGNWLDQVINN